MNAQRWPLARPALAGLVLLGHVALLWLPTAPPRPSPPATATRVPAMLWLPAMPAAPRIANAAPHHRPGETGAERGRRPQAAKPLQTAPPVPQGSPVPPAPPVQPAPRAGEGAVGQAGPGAEPAALGQAITVPAPDHPDSHFAAAPRAPTPRPPLQLALPARRASAPPAAWAAQDDRLSAPAPTGPRWSAGLATERAWREQQLDGGLRLRRGQDCLVVRPARDSALNPFNSSVNPLPKAVGNC